MVAKGGMWGWNGWEIGTGMYTLLCIKETANEKLPCSTGNRSQSSVVT